ncbi:hypothetical protein ON010_g17291 [Phytophthora cinnamomi]|nr:hypothetical protein ON010_g17291 [Phytophthora cinnamomi]
MLHSIDIFDFIVLKLVNGEWCPRKAPSGATRSYPYYQLLIEALERQQESRWRNLRCRIHAGNASAALPVCYVKNACALGDKTCDDFFGPEQCSFDTSQRREIRGLVWRGIPMSRRPELYLRMSGATGIHHQFPRDYFLSLTRRLEDPTDMVHSAAKNSRFAVAKKQIQVDLKRTFAGNDKCWLTSDAGQKSLQRVLLAYALHNDDLGYCQSMTFVVGRLLCLFHNRTSDSKTNTLENTSELPIEEEERNDRAAGGWYCAGKTDAEEAPEIVPTLPAAAHTTDGTCTRNAMVAAALLRRLPKRDYVPVPGRALLRRIFSCVCSRDCAATYLTTRVAGGKCGLYATLPLSTSSRPASA